MRLRNRKLLQAAEAATPSAVVPTPAAVTPSVPTPPLTLADYDKLATASLNGTAETPAPATPPATPTAGQESPPAEPVAAAPAAGDSSAVQTPGAEAEEIADPTPEELATLNEAGQRALKAERQKRRDAREENKQLRARLAELEQKPAPPAEPTPATPPTPAAPSAETGTLVDCDTFEAVDARAMQAATVEAAALRLNQTFLREGYAAVLPQLAEHGIVEQDGKLVHVASKRVLGEANDETVSGFIANVFEGARTAQAQAPIRKTFLAQRAQSFERAATILPQLRDVKSPEYQQIAGLFQKRAELRSLANGPEIAVKLYLGELAWNAKLTKPAAAVPPKPAPTVPPHPASAPGAPRLSVPTNGPGKDRKTELSAKIAAGQASLAEVDEYSALALTPAGA